MCFFFFFFLDIKKKKAQRFFSLIFMRNIKSKKIKNLDKEYIFLFFNQGNIKETVKVN